MLRVENGAVIVSPWERWLAFADAVDERGAIQSCQFSDEIDGTRYLRQVVVGGVEFACDWDDLIAVEQEQMEAVYGAAQDAREVDYWFRQ